MRDITSKYDSRRTARATARVLSGDGIAELLERARADKGDALEIARVAGIMAAKKTWETIPLCHPIPVTHADVAFEVGEGERVGELVLHATCSTIAPTGCEIEALTAVSIAALSIYDVLKPHTDDLAIEGIRLLEKRGGKSDFRDTFDPPVTVAILVTSEPVVSGAKPDRAGQTVRSAVTDTGDMECVHYEVVGQDREAVAARLQALVHEGHELLLTVGGTGLGEADATVQLASDLIDTEIPGIMEAARSYGQRRTPFAMLSRGVAGLADRTLVVTVPGSSRGARETMDGILTGVRHILASQRMRRQHGGERVC